MRRETEVMIKAILIVLVIFFIGFVWTDVIRKTDGGND